jgi:16S rRNA processing protein RimM
LHTQFPERFAERKRLLALDASGRRRELQLEDFWSHKNRVVLKFRGIDSITEAESLVGCELQISFEDRAPLTDNSVYTSDVVGCTVVDVSQGGLELGTILRVEFGAGEAPLLIVRSPDDREYLIPFASEYLVRVDTEGRRVELRLPEGLLQLTGTEATGKPQRRNRRRSLHGNKSPC